MDDIVIGIIKLIDGLEEGLIKKKTNFFHQKKNYKTFIYILDFFKYKYIKIFGPVAQLDRATAF